MKVGFTGTREGMTESQVTSLEQWVLLHQGWTEFHHGCCIGSDATAVSIFYDDRGALFDGVIHGHPSNLTYLTSEFAVQKSDDLHSAKPPLERNRDIVTACDVLLACPKGAEEIRSGTWASVRAARRAGKRVVIFWPDGAVTEKGGG